MEFSAAEAASAMDAGELTSEELTRGLLERADEYDQQLGIFMSRFDDQALEAARAADRRRAAGERGPLLGLPIGVKDILLTVEGPTTAQSLVHDTSWGAGEDAPAVARLRAAGAVVLGKTTTMEFALGTPDPGKPFPLPRNPWAVDRWPGGSSSGSAAGVAAEVFPLALGTDTGASVRQPAALCGVTGFKPTYGVIPKSGCVPLAYSLDHVGPIAHSAADCIPAFRTMAGPHPADPATAGVGPLVELCARDEVVRGLRIGVDDLSRFSGHREDPAVRPAFEAATRVLREAGATIIEVELPYYGEMAAVCAITTLAEALAYHTPDVRRRWTDYFSSTRAALGMGAFVSGSDYVQAQRVRRVGQEAAANLFTEVDLVLTPTVAQASPSHDEASAYVGSFFEGRNLAFHTAYWNVLGNPSLSVPMGFNADGLPLGLQLAGRPLDDELTLACGVEFQARTTWHRRRPEMTVLGPQVDAEGGDGGRAEARVSSPEAPWLLAHAGMEPPEIEAQALAQAYDLVRQNAERLHALPEARYVAPSLFRV